MDENLNTCREALLHGLRDGCVLPSLLTRYASDLVDENKPRSVGMEWNKWTAVTAVVQSSAFLDVLVLVKYHYVELYCFSFIALVG